MELTKSISLFLREGYHLLPPTPFVVEAFYVRTTIDGEVAHCTPTSTNNRSTIHGMDLSEDDTGQESTYLFVPSNRMQLSCCHLQQMVITFPKEG